MLVTYFDTEILYFLTKRTEDQYGDRRVIYCQFLKSEIVNDFKSINLFFLQKKEWKSIFENIILY